MSLKKIWSFFANSAFKERKKNISDSIIIVQEDTFHPTNDYISGAGNDIEHIRKKREDKRNRLLQKNIPRHKKIKEEEEFVMDVRNIRDIVEIMEVPFVSLSTRRTEPIIYQSQDKKTFVKITAHSGHYIASIHDWDIILFIAGKLQEILNSGSDIPPRTLKIPRYELLKALYRGDGNTDCKKLEESLARLRLTGIETTIHNEDSRYRGGFGFIDDWGYTERKDCKEFQITLSRWLYDIACKKGSLLKVESTYFRITSPLRKFLYRIARKHVGTQNRSWKLSLETLYEKSGSERDFRKFKHDLKKEVEKYGEVPGYFCKWIEDSERCYINFISMRKELKSIVDGCSEEEKKMLK